MLRAMILTLTLLIITVSAAYLARDEQLTQALRFSQKIPVEQEQYLQSESEIPQMESTAQLEQAESEAPTESETPPESEAPRFVPNEPIASSPSSAIILPPQASDTDGASQLDPSAHAQAAPSEESSAYTPSVPSEEQKLNAAKPFVRELFSLKENAARELDALADSALSEYLSTAPDRRADALPLLMEKYLPQVMALESRTDEQAESIFMKLAAALAAINADDTILKDAREAYAAAKQEQTQRYLSLFSQVGQQ